MARMGRSRPGRCLVVTAAAALVLLQLTRPQSFVGPPGPKAVHRSASQSPSVSLEASLVAAAVGLAPLIVAPQASVAEGWEMMVAAPLGLINTGLNVFKFCLGIYALLSWLYAFGIAKRDNEIVQKVQGALSGLVDPVLQPLRAIIPAIGGFDISFMVLWFVIEQAQAAAVSIMVGAMSYNTLEYF